MANPGRGRQASPAVSEGTQTRHPPVWTCPELEGDADLLHALGKSIRFRQCTVPFCCPPTTFAQVQVPHTVTQITTSMPTAPNTLPPHTQPNLPIRNSRLASRLPPLQLPPAPLQRNVLLRYRTSSPSPSPPSPNITTRPMSRLNPTADLPNHPPTPKSLKGALLNTLSLNNHALEVRDLIESNDLDFLALTETWLHEVNGPTLEAAVPSNYSIKYESRQDKRGGGVAIIHKDNLPFYRSNVQAPTKCEAMLLKLNTSPSHTLNFLTIYRPPEDMPEFNLELLQILASLSKTNTHTLLLGDLNLGRSDPKDKPAISLEKDLSALNFSINNNDPTHRKGRTLDWVASSNCKVNISSTLPCIWSDHLTVNFAIELPEPILPTPNPPTLIYTRQLKKLTPSILEQAINEIMTSTTDSDHPDLITAAYQRVMSATLQNYAPLKNKTIRLTKNAAKWFTPELKTLLAKKRKAEQTWLASNCDSDKIEWKIIASQYKKLIQKTKKSYFQTRIEQANNKTKELFTILKEVEKPLKEPPQFTPTADDCVAVQNFFANKISTARSRITNRLPQTATHTLDDPTADLASAPPPPRPTSLSQEPSETRSLPFILKPVSQDFLLKTLKSMKPCPDKGDIFPSKIILQNAALFAPLLTRIVNSSFSHASIPAILKDVSVTPIPKKPKADLKNPANLRPITTVMFLLKLLDKIATCQLQEHIVSHQLLHERQSGFRSGYSTETALLDLQTKMRALIEDNKAGLLVLLDLSAAFDLVDHSILLKRLLADFACSPSACTWLHSFLSDRHSRVKWGESESPPETLAYGVPQGSCISPTLFNLYLAPLFLLLEQQGVVFTNYADDTQLLLELSGNHEADTIRLNSIYNTIKSWMDSNWMCLNGSKTELLIISSKQKRSKMGPAYNNFSLDDTLINVASQVKTLGVILDAHLTMTPHCSTLYNAAQYHLKLLRAIRPCLSTAHSTSLARATIMPRLDYCNSLLNNTSKANIQKLQHLQNDAVRIAAMIPKREHISDARRSLHWLPVADRINFKVLSITHRCIHGKAPNYLSSTIKSTPSTRNLRSNAAGSLFCPKAMKKCGNRSSFTYAAPHAWNSLPRDLRLVEQLEPFKKQLKTLLFK